MYNGQLKKRGRSYSKPNKKFIQLTKDIKTKFNKKYSTDESFYNKQMIDQIIFNEKCHIFVCFREFLLYEDDSEFLRRYYKLDEADDRLPRYFEYYEKCSKIFPNYTALYESKYIYKNIQRKQKLINLQQKIEIEILNKKNTKDENKEDNVFNTEVYNSIMNVTSGIDQEIINLFNNEDKQPNPLKSSLHSIEDLMEVIDKAEKSCGMKRNKIPTAYKSKLNGIETIKRMLSPDDKKCLVNKGSPNTNTNNIPRQDKLASNENKIPIPSDATKKTAYKSNRFMSKFLKDNNDKNIEANILSLKFKHIKQRSRISSDLTNATHASQSKSKLNQGPGNSSTISKERKRSGSKVEDKAPDSSRVQPVCPNENEKKKDSEKNIFYIINQNPQMSTHITIYNDIADNKKSTRTNSATKNFRVRSITPRGESTSVKAKGNDDFIKKVKEQIKNATTNKTKKPETIISTAKVQSHTKTRSVISSCLSGNTGITYNETSRQTSKNKKEELLRYSVPSFTARNVKFSLNYSLRGLHLQLNRI